MPSPYPKGQGWLTTQENADLFLAKLKEYFPKEYFYITEYFAPKIDPDFTDFIMEGSHVVEPFKKLDDMPHNAADKLWKILIDDSNLRKQEHK